jgi:hypothetical protein
MTDKKDKVGYMSPPKHTRFRPGQSGNPHGRKKGSINTLTLLEIALNEQVNVDSVAGTRQITKKQAIMLQLVNQSAKGDLKATAQILPLMQQLDSRNESLDKQHKAISSDDEAIIQRFLDGHTGK